MPTTRDSIDGATPMGATIRPPGVTFRVWAPAAKQVFVLTGAAAAAAVQPGFVPDPNDTMFAFGDGTWGAYVAGLGEGSTYRFWVAGAGSEGLKRDPRARELSTAPAYPHCDCLVRAPSTYAWHDGAFRAPEFRDLILYQLHIGVYYAVDAQGADRRSNIGKFLDLLDRIDYLRDLGINGVQLMPIQEFASPTSQGYNGLDIYAPEMDYQVVGPAELAPYVAKANALLAVHGAPPLSLGDLAPGPNQLKCVIDILHLNGIAVLFDLVFNHAGPGFNDESLWFLDRQPPGDDNRSLYFTDHEWVGGRIFAYWNADVRAFLIDNARQCADELHIDGIRYDEVTVIERNGGSRFCQDLSRTMRFHKPRLIQIAEYWADERAAAVRPVEQAGLGFDAAWGDRLREGIREAIGQASGGRDAFVDIDRLAAAFDTPGGFDAGWRVVNCLENHDIVQNGRAQRIARLADPADARSWYARSRARVAAGLLFAGRGIPMLFMGQEILEDKPWSDNVAAHPDLLIWWEGLAQEPARRDYRRFFQDLAALRRAQPALRSDSLRVSTRSSLDRVIAIHRWMEGEGHDLLVVANLQEWNRFEYRIGFPSAAQWREIFNSDYYENPPNPAVAGNGGTVVADGPPWDGMPASAAITLPANGFLIFSRE